MRRVLIVLFSTISIFASQLVMGEIPKEVILHDDIGGKVTGEPFSTKQIKGKVYLVSYVDPDFKDTNSVFFDKVKAQNYDRSLYNSIVIINFAATWLPDFAISASLKSKQKKFPHTIFVEDRARLLVKERGMIEDAAVVMLFDSEGKLLFIQNGELTPAQRQEVISLIDKRVLK